MTRENSKSVRRGKLGRRSVLASGGGVAAAASFGFPSIAQSSLRGTRLTVLASNWFVPENNTQLDQLAADVSRDTGMEVRIERFAGDELSTKVASVIATGRGADIAVGVEFDTYLYANRLADVTELADEIGRTYGGWFDVARAACMVNGRWRSLCIGQAPAAWNYRVDHFAAAGINQFPDTFDDLLKAAQTLHARGTPIGMTLGHASGDGRSTNYPVLWAFGGKEFEEDGRTVALDSPQTLRAVEWYAEIYKYFIPGTTAWLDADNNQAFLASKISATVNVNTIYLASRAAADPARKAVADNMNHGLWPRGPAGRFANYNINVWLPFASSQNQEGQRAFLRAWYSRSFLPNWTKTGQSYFIPTFAGFDNEDVWPADPKLRIFRELNKLNRLPGYSGPPTPAAAEAVSKYVLVDMFAKACTGQMKPAEAVKWAAREYEQIARRRRT